MTETRFELKKSLRLIDSTALVAGSMIGSGIFIVSADMSRQLGSPGWLLVTWVITGIMTLIAALSYGELAGMMPKAGGQYVYLREAYNPLTGFLYGWTLFLVIQTGTIAAVAMAFAKFTGVLIPWVSEKNIWLDLGFVKFNTVHIIAIGSLIFITWMNSKGIKTGKIVQNSFTFTKVGLLIAFIVVGLIIFHGNGAFTINKSIFWEARSVDEHGYTTLLSGFALVAVIGTSMVGSLFSSDAWNNITFTAGEIINPRRNIPLSLFFGTLIVTIIYLLMNFVYIYALPLRGDPAASDVMGQGMQFAVNDRLGTASMSMLLGGSASLVMAVLVMISTFGCNNGLILSGARVYYAMAQDGLFFKGAGKINKSGVPSISLWVQCLWAGLLCLTGTYSNLLDYVIFSVLIFYILTIIAVFILRIKQPGAARPYKAFGYPLLPALYVAAALFIMILLLIYKPLYTWPGLIIVCIGFPVYYFWKKDKPQKIE
ncbi:MAG TPA: amino acid permease [Bacteroidales bacterium]|nr:amino acid permease [Bacteroidales bacterium]